MGGKLWNKDQKHILNTKDYLLFLPLGSPLSFLRILVGVKSLSITQLANFLQPCPTETCYFMILFFVTPQQIICILLMKVSVV